MTKVKLAEALLRRKELQQKVDQIKGIKDKDLYEVKARRQGVTDSIEDFIAQVPKVTLAQVTAEYDHYAKQLRLVDAAIQHANWETEIEVGDHVMANYADLPKK
jgi:hypothetical protein